jgi:hypothetical protein
MITESKLKLYSLGIVVQTKPDDTDIIKVVPIEEYSYVDGKLSEHKEEFKADYKDMAGTIKKASAESSVIIEARWFPFAHSNRITSPDVVVNETVIIFSYADTDKYYWTTIYREPKLRRLERVLYAFSNLATGITKRAFDKLSSYWYEVSTKDKHIWLKTTKSDGEPFEYDVKIDTRKGYVEVKDDVGNYYVLDSPSNTITINALEKIHLKAPFIHFEATERVLTTAPKIDEKGDEITETAGGGITNTAGGTITERAGKVLCDTPIVENTGEEYTAGASRANPHICAVDC